MSTSSDDANKLIVSAVSSGAGADRQVLANLLASCVERRRRQLGFSVERAAELAGIPVWQWNALERGWVPSDPNVLKAIAWTLQACYHHLSLIAEVSLYNQDWAA